MKFKNKQECISHFRKYTSYEGELPNYWLNPEKPNMGQLMLFSIIKDKTISTPILGLVVGHTVWDQALVLEYIEPYRAYHSNSRILNAKGELYHRLMEHDQEVQFVQSWTDDIKVYKIWDNRPKVKDMLPIYREHNL